MTTSAEATEERGRVAALPVEAKVRLLTGADSWRTYGDDVLGLRPIVMSDGPAGVRGVTKDDRNPSASLPCPSALGATWDSELVRELAAALGAEARGKGIDVVLAPTINLMRTPLGGRGFECFSEDPVLSARIAAGYVAGLQSAGVGAAVKHYVGNDSETGRWTYDARIAETVLRELYLVPFEACVREAGALHGDGRLQLGQRRADDRAPGPAARGAEGRVGLHRRGGVGLERRPQHGGHRPGGPGPGHAGAARPLGRGPGRGGPRRCRRRGGDRRQGAPAAPAGPAGGGAGWAQPGRAQPGRAQPGRAHAGRDAGPVRTPGPGCPGQSPTGRPRSSQRCCAGPRPRPSYC